MLARKPLKKKKCKVCGSEYQPRSSGQIVCAMSCAIALNKQRAEKLAARKQADESRLMRQLKEKVKPRSKWLSEAQSAVNRYVRIRDAHLGCVSCDKPAEWHGQWHASHLRSVGSSGHLRFNLFNIHKACSVCNAHLSGNLVEYLPRLRRRIGDEKVDWLYRQNYQRSFDIEYLKRIKLIFSKKIRALERRRKD